MQTKEFITEYGRPEDRPEEVPDFAEEDKFALEDAGYVTLRFHNPEGGYACAVDPNRLIIPVNHMRAITRRSVRENVARYAAEKDGILPDHMQHAPGIRIGSLSETLRVIGILGNDPDLRNNALQVRYKQIITAGTNRPFDVLRMTKIPGEPTRGPLDPVSETSVYTLDSQRTHESPGYYIMPMVFALPSRK